VPRNCVNSPDNFAIFAKKLLFNTETSINTDFEKAYECYFGCKVVNQDKKWVPHVCCISCATIPHEWLNNKGRSVRFALPMILREPTDHLTDCYFCVVPPIRHGITKKERTVNYPNISSAVRPVPHTEDHPDPVPPQQFILDSDEEPTENRQKTSQPSTSTNADFTADIQCNKFHRITQHKCSS
jgi:hypothetical protein